MHTSIANKARANRPHGRTIAAVAFIAASALLTACGTRGEHHAMTADLERDLQMAIDARPAPSMVVSAIEGGAVNAPSGTQRGRRDAMPTPRRTPRPAPQADVQESVVTENNENSAAPDAPVEEQKEATQAPASDHATAVPAVDAEHGAAADRGPSAGAGEGEGHGDVGVGHGRRGGGWGTVIGVIIRGGAAGIDNCEEHDRRRAGRRGGAMGGTMGGHAGGVIVAGGVLGGVIGGVIAGNGGTIRPTFPR